LGNKVESAANLARPVSLSLKLTDGLPVSAARQTFINAVNCQWISVGGDGGIKIDVFRQKHDRPVGQQELGLC